MKILVIFAACLAAAAGFGLNWKNVIAEDGQNKDFLFDYMTKDHIIDNDQHVILGGDKKLLGDHIDLNLIGGKLDLKTAIMNDKDIFRKQKFILDIFRNVYTTLVLDDIRDDRFIIGETNYINYERVVPLFRLYDLKLLLTRGRVFSLFNKTHKFQAIALFNLFYYSKDFDVFQRNVLWARNNINEDMFVYCLHMAIFQRHDMIGIKLPSYYEIAPQKFHTDFTIRNAVNLRMGNIHDKVLIVYNNYTSDINIINDEAKLAYLTEDISWNLFHYYLFMQFPDWLGGEEFGLNKQMRGQSYLYLLQQHLARYYLERLSHGLGPIDDISFRFPIKTGYNSFLRHFNGLGYSVRKNYYDVYTTGDYYLIARILDFERRIRDAVDKGFCLAKDGGMIGLTKRDGVNILGNLIQSNKDSVNDRFYGGLVRMMRTLLGGGHLKITNNLNVLPSVMEDYATAMRDPVTYQLYKRILKLYYLYLNNLPHYTVNDLLVKGIRILDIHTTKLVTFMDKFDVDISNIVNHGIRTYGKDKGIDNVQGELLTFARHTRLNQKPFSINIDVESDKAQKVLVRLFLGPKFDHMGRKIMLNQNRDNFIQIDRFFYDLTVGKVTIKRDSRDFSYNLRDRTTYMDLYKNILATKDLNKLLELNIVESHCGYPQRLLLPRGWTSGMPMQLYVIITRATNYGKGPSFLTKCGRDLQWFRGDDFYPGFPFDRHIDETEFYTTNMLFKDVFIYHDGVDTNIGLNTNLGMRDIADLLGDFHHGLDSGTIRRV